MFHVCLERSDDACCINGYHGFFHSCGRSGAVGDSDDTCVYVCDGPMVMVMVMMTMMMIVLMMIVVITMMITMMMMMMLMMLMMVMMVVMLVTGTGLGGGAD